MSSRRQKEQEREREKGKCVKVGEMREKDKGKPYIRENPFFPCSSPSSLVSAI